MLLECDEAPDLFDHVSHRPDVGQVVQRDVDIEAIFQFANEFEHLKGIETQTGQQLALGFRVDVPPAHAIEDLERALLDPIGRRM